MPDDQGEASIQAERAISTSPRVHGRCQRAYLGEFSKRITEDFAISFGSTYTFLGPIDPTATGTNGFQNLETTFKCRLFKDPAHELVMSVGLSVE